ncbi:hypothetical protein Acr_20g0007430 [Actinidia rufa]|uniref:Uncharacterized protein n=1 Tax=Actinidia rufa TaxID=165716 RepID=A0A7J0GDW4_9ERIC|nr:hypothetical protein Acr_20g0007430 [Actinidia rufa]
MSKVEEEILLHLGRQLGVRPWTIPGAWGFKDSEIVEHAIKCCNMLLALIEIISGMLKRGQFYPIKADFCLKSFLRGFALDFKKMVSSGKDNAKEKPTGDAAHIVERAQVYNLGGERCGHRREVPRDEMPYISPSKKGKQVADAKKKGPMSPFEDKKKGASCQGSSQVQGDVKLGDERGGEEAPLRVHFACRLGSDGEIEHRSGDHKVLSLYNLEVPEGGGRDEGEGGYCQDVGSRRIGLLHPDLDIEDLQIDFELVQEDEEEEKDKLDNSFPPQ